MENRNRFGLRDDDELVAIIVVLILVILLGFYFINSFRQSDTGLDDVAGAIGVVDDDSTPVVEEMTPTGEANTTEATTSAEVENTPQPTATLIEKSTQTVATESPEEPTEVAQVSAPTLALATTNFPFGPVEITGQGSADADISVDVDGETVGTTKVAASGDWAYTIPLGQISSGDHSVVATSGDQASQSQVFTLGEPEAPTLSANYDETVVKPGKYEITGSATPNWFVGIGVADVEPSKIPTDENGDWAATIDLETPGTYDLEVFAINADGSVNRAISTGSNRIIVTADGQPPAPTVDVAATSDAQAAADATATAEAQAVLDATATAEAQAAADATATAEAVPVVTIYDQLQASGQHETLLTALFTVGVPPELTDNSQAYTVFAPTDAAFAKLPEDIRGPLLSNPDALRKVLDQHVITGTLTADDLKSAENTTLTNFDNNPLSVSLDGETIKIDQSNVTLPPIEASNGLIYNIDQVLLPPSDFMQPVIDVEGVPIFKGTVLTVVGTAQPNSTLILTLNDIQFGKQIVGEDGRFEITGDINDGEYIIKAYSLDSLNLLQTRSNPVSLIVDNS